MYEPQRAHLIGVSGNGMFPLALLLNEAGFAVTGSDRRLNPARRAILDARGIVTWKAMPHRHNALQAWDGVRVVASPAIPRHHPELRAARQYASRIGSRAAALAGLIAERETICIAGSHGKSTVTAMLMAILAADRNNRFGYMIGAEGAAAVPARLGPDDSLFVTEACEAHGALSEWRPTHAILTNADDEHTDHYPSGGGLQGAFLAFLNRVPPHGAVVACGDDPGAAALVAQLSRPVLTYGFGAANRLRADLSGRNARIVRDDAEIGVLSLQVPGEHNIRNALAALAMALHLDIAAPTALEALSGFCGVKRRLECVEAGDGPRIFDDFAHHPAEIMASLTALRPSTEGRLIAVLEPQLHSRVTRLATDFAEALRKADLRFVLPVADDGEQMIGAGGNAALAASCKLAGVKIEPATSVGDLVTMLGSIVQDRDTLIVMSGSHDSGLALMIRERLRTALLQQARSATYDLPSKPSVLIGRKVDDVPDVLAAILANAQMRPDALAIEMGTRRLTYQQLVSRAVAIAGQLSTGGIASQDVVGVCLPRSTDRVAALVATLLLGAVYLPLDPALPRSRIDQMLADSGARALVVNAASPALTVDGLALVSCDLIGCTGSLAVSQSRPDGLAYAIYTSGTSGQPKAVLAGRRALSNYAASAIKRFDIAPGSRVSLVSAFGFDVSIGDMVMALTAGACLVLPTDLQAQPGHPLSRFLRETKLSHLSLTPSLLAAIPAGDYPDLQAIIVAGEMCAQHLVDRWALGRQFFNAYGPTEATVEVTIARCEPKSGVTVGTPIDNAGICILSDELHPTAIGTEGEVCIFGAALAAGYHARPGLTANRFPLIAEADWHPEKAPLRVYRTGDRGFIDHSGQLCLTGRMDEQVKFNGFRIEPVEIEAVLCRQPEIREACVSVIRSPNGKNRLVAHVVTERTSGPFDPECVSQRLKQILPRYMLPSVFLPVQAIPQTLNGKRDRSALPAPKILLQPRPGHGTKSATELKLLELLSPFADDGPPAGRRKSLSAWGLDSLAMANFLMDIERHFNISLDMALEPGADTIETLALMVEARIGEPARTACGGVSHVVSRMQPLLAGWPGIATGRTGLLRRVAQPRGDAALFWICQLGSEFEALAHALGGDGIEMIGLRSGDRILDYASDDLPAITQLYADEIESAAPRGPLHLGGNCQGGMMMRLIALELLRRGREIGLVILMEQSRFSPTPIPVLLLFGERSYLNPYAQMRNPEHIFRLAYSGGYDVEMISGGHGEYFLPQNVTVLAEAILRHLKPRLRSRKYA